MNLWKNQRPTFTEWATLPLGETRSAPWQPATQEEIAARLAETQPSPISIPAEVGRAQLRVAMLRLGWVASRGQIDPIVTAAIEAAVPAGPMREEALTLWETAAVFKFAHPFTPLVGLAMGRSQEQVAELFRVAETV